MKNILKSKKGLSTVVTTLIILVVSVLLATVVTYYAINITTNRMAQESLQMSNLHVWYNTTAPTLGGTGWAEAAFTLINTGGKDVVLQSITTRSQASTWSNVYYNASNTLTISSISPTAPLSGPNGVATISGTASSVKLTNATYANGSTGVITLKAGYTLVVYIMHPGSIGQNDVGTPVDVTVFTANAQWTQETNVQATQ
ncbi:MAG TPA: hypothetical protein VK487_03280 [Candidatus Bathyarchaeia archaeon]|nr:hypothetical protein [Candidatus Bathyarchaeia archaeon]